MLVVAFLVVLAASPTLQAAVKNPGFESNLAGHWEGVGFHIERSSDAHTGSHSLKCSGRMSSHYLGPEQIVNLTPGKMYKLSAYLKQLNDMPGTLFQKYRVQMLYTYSDNGHDDHEAVAYHTSVRSVDGWFSMAGYFRAPQRALSMAKLKFQSPDISIEFLVDDVSLTQVADPADWKAEADARIQQLRKGDIHFTFDLAHGTNAGDIDIQVDLVKHSFGWGTLVQDQWMIDAAHKGYQDMVYKYFNTAVTQGLKWKFDRGTPGHPDYSQAMACVDALREKGMLVRAHNLFWGFSKNLPAHVLSTPHAQLNATVQDHLRYMINITKGKADHWDVMNELVHGQWFEEQFQDPDYSERLYTQVHQLDTKPLLMLNDFNVVGRPDINNAYLQQAQGFLSRGIPLHGLGLQSHFHDATPDPVRMMLNLDHVALAGLPLWVTELDVWETDLATRAEHYETVLRVFFSHPAVEGVLLWGFWDQHVVDKRSSLVDGHDLTINAAGHRYFNLIKNTWSTHVNRSLSSGTSFHLNGFKGDYEVTVLSNGVTVKVVPFTLNGNHRTVNINVDSTTTITAIPPPDTPSGVVKDSSGGYLMGTASSSSSSSHTSGLVCNTYHGRTTDATDEAEAQVKCHLADEVMTGCSSIHKNHDYHREGEQMLTQRGHVVCKAVDGVGTTGGVQAVARCCKAAGLQCRYRASGLGPSGLGATISAACLSTETPMGCSTWGSHNNGGGAVSNHSSCTSTSNDPNTGVYSYAACCSAPSLSCVTVTSAPGGAQGALAHVACPAGHTLTGCNFLSEGGAKAAGASVAGNLNCQAYAVGALSAGQAVRAVATCCKAS